VEERSATRDVIVEPPPASCTGAGRRQVRLRFMLDDKKFKPPVKHAAKLAIITVHGNGGAPQPLFSGVKAKVDEGGYANDVWVIAPQFLDLGQTAEESGTLYWEPSDFSSIGQSVGDASIRPNGVQISSFEIMDYLIRRVKNDWTADLQEIIVFGFGGGAGFVNRYSMSTNIDSEIGIRIRYIMASPSDYASLLRPRYDRIDGNPPQYQPRTIDAECSALGPGFYDNYPYGVTPKPGIPADHYVAGMTRPQFQYRIRAKHRLYLVGSADTLLGGSLDPSCPARQQGQQRVDRAWSNWHLASTGGYHTNASFCIVPGVDHSGNPLAMSNAVTQYWEWGHVLGVDQDANAVDDCLIGPRDDSGNGTHWNESRK
jgi:hypothetical protein